MKSVKQTLTIVLLLLISLIVSACSSIPDLAPLTETAPAIPVNTLTASQIHTPEPSPTIETQLEINPTETLFIEVSEGYESVLLLTEGKARSFLNRDRTLEEVKQGVVGMAEQLINFGITKIAGPKLAQAELETLATGPVEIAVLDTEDETVPEGYYSIQARGFEAGGWGIFVEGPDGLLRVVCPVGKQV